MGTYKFYLELVRQTLAWGLTQDINKAAFDYLLSEANDYAYAMEMDVKEIWHIWNEPIRQAIREELRNELVRDNKAGMGNT